MPRGGHSRVGPPASDAATRAVRGAETRRRHRIKGDAGAARDASHDCDPPKGLDRLERNYWNYYAARMPYLPASARDALSKYCTALATIARLKGLIASRKPADVLLRDARRKDLRQWILGSRLYETDLILTPASSIRAPRGAVAPASPTAPVDPFAAFIDLEDGDEETIQ
jgi:hypothetical protein